MMTECVIDENDPFYENIFHGPMLSSLVLSNRSVNPDKAEVNFLIKIVELKGNILIVENQFEPKNILKSINM